MGYDWSHFQDQKINIFYVIVTEQLLLNPFRATISFFLPPESIKTKSFLKFSEGIETVDQWREMDYNE